VSRPSARHEGPAPLEWIESAVQLLRTAPPGALLCYYIGSVPCLLGLLYFWTDMSRGAFAAGHLVESSLSVAALYIWMKCWQTVFLSKLRAQLLLEPEAPWTGGRIVRMAVVQAALQPIGLFLRLLAAQVLIPYIWMYTLFLGIAILGDGTEPGLGATVRAAWREATLWWRQTHLALLCLFGFALFILFNVIVVCALLPFAARTLLGIESPFTRNVWVMFNSTFFAATLAVTYLCFDPLRKAVFLVRHFHGVSLQSGEDLRVGLKALRRPSRVAAAALILFATLGAGPLLPVRAAEPPPPAHVEPPQLDDALNRVLERREYAWRLPREAEAETEHKGWVATFFEKLGRTIMSWVRKAQKLAEKFGDWLHRLFFPDKSDSPEASSGLDWGTMARWVLVILALTVCVALGVLLWRSRKNIRGVGVSPAVATLPDLNQESVTADQLPEDGWLQLARDLMDGGELRLALRAFYLATLAHLGSRELIRLARHKSNHDYDRELQRRARGKAGLLDAFDENLLTFERAWYGEHDVTPDTLDGFSQNLERIRAC